MNFLLRYTQISNYTHCQNKKKHSFTRAFLYSQDNHPLISRQFFMKRLNDALVCIDISHSQTSYSRQFKTYQNNTCYTISYTCYKLKFCRKLSGTIWHKKKQASKQTKDKHCKINILCILEHKIYTRQITKLSCLTFAPWRTPPRTMYAHLFPHTSLHINSHHFHPTNIHTLWTYSSIPHKYSLQINVNIPQIKSC